MSEFVNLPWRRFCDSSRRSKWENCCTRNLRHDGSAWLVQRNIWTKNGKCCTDQSEWSMTSWWRLKRTRETCSSIVGRPWTQPRQKWEHSESEIECYSANSRRRASSVQSGTMRRAFFAEQTLHADSFECVEKKSWQKHSTRMLWVRTCNNKTLVNWKMWHQIQILQTWRREKRWKWIKRPRTSWGMQQL